MTLINQNDPQFNKLFGNVQGNILKGHGREHTANIFITCYKGERKSVKHWIKSLLREGVITSAKKQLEETAHFKATGIGGGTFGTLLFSAKGYEYLGIHTAGKFSDSFLNGMKQADLNDPELDEWEYGFRGDIHFMLLIADDNKEKVFALTEIYKTQIERFGSVMTVEYGNALRNSDNAGIEHFGYVDGTSQPLFFEDELERYKKENNVERDGLIYDPSADKSLILVDDPLTETKDAMGSYFVFRKLAQKVRDFKANEKQLAEDLGLSEKTGDDERAGAMIVGRFENGTPVEMKGSEEKDAAEKIWLRNNFDYQTTGNSKCPFHGHIRKANPRSGHPFGGLEESLKHVMARRGVTFGVRTDGPNDGEIENKPENGLGLLFMSYQASLAEQFEFIQKNWVNEANFPFDGSGGTKVSGIDPVIGQDGAKSISTGEFAKEYGKIDTLQSGSFGKFVTMKGGEYFFSPSIPFLNSLA